MTTHAPQKPELRRLRLNGELTGALIFKHPCSGCGKPDAAFGRGVYLEKFLKSVENKKRDESLLGTWTCGMDGCLEGKNENAS